MVINFCFCYYYCVRQTVTFCLSYEYTFLEVCLDGELSALALVCVLTETHGHPDRMYGTTNVSKALNLEFHWDTFSRTFHITSPAN